jgi:hypothetical protein
MNAITAFYKSTKQWKLQPTPNHRASHQLLWQFIGFSKVEQKLEKAKFTHQNTQAAKNKIKDAIPGTDCTCCKSKAQQDKGKKWGTNAASKKKQCRSKRKRGKDRAVASSNTDEGDNIEDIYVSLGHNKTHQQPRKKYKKQITLEHSGNVQMQSADPAMRDLHGAIEKVIHLLTRCTMPPTHNEETHKERYNQQIPRHRILLVSVNNVVETRLSGSKVPAERLRCEKTKITYICSSKMDVKKVVNAICQDYQDPEKFETVKLFGTKNKTAIDRYREEHVVPRRSSRARRRWGGLQSWGGQAQGSH